MRGRHEYGLTAHAFVAATKLLLREYTLLVAQLEGQARAGRLSLQRLWFYAQPSSRTLGALSRICAEAAPFSGGALLNAVHATAVGGSVDQHAREVYAFLLHKAAAPLLRMLERWLYEGELDDPYDEFMVSEDRSLAKENMLEDFNASYWEGRFTLRSAWHGSHC